MPDLLNQTPRTAPRAAPARPPRAAPGAPSPRGGLRQRSRVLTGLVAALAVAATGLLIVEAVCLIAWIAEPRSAAPLGDALRTGSAFWLLGHGGRLRLPAGTGALIPLGLSLLFVSLAARAGAAVARVRPVGPRRRILPACALAVAVPYALIAGLVAEVSSGGGLRPSVVTAMVGALALSAAGAFVGAARELPMASPKRSQWQAVAAGVGAAGALLLAVSALVAAIALVTHLSDAAALARPAKAGAVGGFGLLVLQAALAPNAVAWSASYLLGPGFAVGAGTLVSPTGVHLGDVPGLPMLAGLPSSAVAWPVYAIFLVPPVAGVLGGVVMVRRLPRRPKLVTVALLSATLAVAVGLAGATLAALSGGPVTRGRLATVGPSALQTGVAALLEIGIPAIVGALGLTWYRLSRRGRVAAAPATLGERIKRLPTGAVAGTSAAAGACGRWFSGLGRSLGRPFGLGRPMSDAPAGDELLADEPVADEPAVEQPVVDETAVEQPVVVQPPVMQPAEAQSAETPVADPAPSLSFDMAETTDLTETLALLRESDADLDPGATRPAAGAAVMVPAVVDLEKHPAAGSEGKHRRLRVPARLRRKPKVIKLPE